MTLTPDNFFESYLLAYKLLKKKENMARDQINRNKIMIEELSVKKDFGAIKILDFDFGTNESKLTHFEVSVDSVFKIKLADFLSLPISLFLPQETLDSLVKIQVNLIGEDGAILETNSFTVPFYSKEDF